MPKNNPDQPELPIEGAVPPGTPGDKTKPNGNGNGSGMETALRMCRRRTFPPRRPSRLFPRESSSRCTGGSTATSSITPPTLSAIGPSQYGGRPQAGAAAHPLGLHEKDDGRFIKVANVVGHTMQYHPHGDASIGDALVVLANKRYLIEGQGNFGNLYTGDVAAAPGTSSAG
jgi:hypothetical protein